MLESVEGEILRKIKELPHLQSPDGSGIPWKWGKRVGEEQLRIFMIRKKEMEESCKRKK